MTATSADRHVGRVPVPSPRARCDHKPSPASPVPPSPVRMSWPSWLSRQMRSCGCLHPIRTVTR